MPAYPQRKCLHCEKPFPRKDQHYGNQPAYCSEVCRLLEKAEVERTGKSKCGRCGERYIRTHVAQRHCKKCQGKENCKLCGKPVPDPRTDAGKATTNSGRTFKLPRKHQYCSRKCQEAAWANTPLPTCRYCKQPVDLPVHVFRDPPKIHYKSCKGLYDHWVETMGPNQAYKAWKKAHPNTDPPKQRHKPNELVYP